jgi:hypothetical protein
VIGRPVPLSISSFLSKVGLTTFHLQSTPAEPVIVCLLVAPGRLSLCVAKALILGFRLVQPWPDRTFAVVAFVVYEALMGCVPWCSVWLAWMQVGGMVPHTLDDGWM